MNQMKRILLLSILCPQFVARICWCGDGLDTWTVRSNSLTSTNWLYDVAFGNDQFVAVGGSQDIYAGMGVVLTSLDRTNWVQEILPTGTGTRLGITHGAGLYVAVGMFSVITSLGGTAWTRLTSSSFSSSAVAYGNSLLVACGGGQVYISTNGITWNRSSLGGGETSFTDLAFGNDLFLAVGGHAGRGGIWTSTNGTTWRGRLSDYLVRSVRYGGGMYIAVGDKGTLKTSADTTTWIARDSGTTNNLLGVAYGGGVFVAVGSGGTILSSLEGTSSPLAGPPSKTTSFKVQLI